MWGKRHPPRSMKTTYLGRWFFTCIAIDKEKGFVYIGGIYSKLAYQYDMMYIWLKSSENEEAFNR